MISVDEHTQAAMEIVSKGAKLSEELILKILKSLTDLLASDKGKEVLLTIKLMKVNKS